MRVVFYVPVHSLFVMFPRVLRKLHSDTEPSPHDDKKYDIYKVSPKMLLSNENAKSDAEAAGPIVR